MVNTDSFDLHVLNLVNNERAKYGIRPLSFNQNLDASADFYAQDLANVGYLTHNLYGTTPRSRAEQTGYYNGYIGENIAYGQITPQEVVADWMNSLGHQENILNPNYTEMGLGYSSNGNYWVQVFGG